VSSRDSGLKKMAAFNRIGSGEPSGEGIGKWRIVPGVYYLLDAKSSGGYWIVGNGHRVFEARGSAAVHASLRGVKNAIIYVTNIQGYSKVRARKSGRFSLQLDITKHHRPVWHVEKYRS